MDLAIDKFHEERFGLVTGSRCSPLVPIRAADVGKRTLAMQLANEKFFKCYDEISTWQTDHGKMSEHEAFEHWNKYVNIGFIQKGKWHKVGETGGTTDAEGDTFGVDFKCPTTINGWLNFLHNDIDKAYYDQAQLYMMLTGFDTWYIAAYLSETLRMGDLGLMYPVPMEKRMIIRKIEVNEDWRIKFNTFLPLVIEMRDNFYNNLKNHFG